MELWLLDSSSQANFYCPNLACAVLRSNSAVFLVVDGSHGFSIEYYIFWFYGERSDEIDVESSDCGELVKQEVEGMYML